MMKNLLVLILTLLSLNAFAEISFKDATGKKVKLSKLPERVIILNSSNMELFYAAGGEPMAYAESRTMPAYIRQKVKGLPSVGKVNNPNVETIASLSPDLVIGMNFPFHLSIRYSIEAAGIKTAMFSANNLKETEEILKIYGKITGKSEVAETAWRDIDSKLKYVAEALKGVDKKKVLVLYGSTESFNMALPSSTIGQMVELAGGINIAAGHKSKGLGMMNRGFAPVSLEHVLMKDPDIVFIITHGDEVSPSADRSLIKHPAWKALRAVQNDKVIKLPFDTYGINPTVRTGDAVKELYSIMYEEQTK